MMLMIMTIINMATSHPEAPPALPSAFSFPQDAPGSVVASAAFPLCPLPGKKRKSWVTEATENSFFYLIIFYTV